MFLAKRIEAFCVKSTGDIHIILIPLPCFPQKDYFGNYCFFTPKKSLWHFLLLMHWQLEKKKKQQTNDSLQ